MGDGRDAGWWLSVLGSIADCARLGSPTEAVESQPAADRHLCRGRKDETAGNGQERRSKARRKRVSKRDVVLTEGRG